MNLFRREHSKKLYSVLLTIMLSLPTSGFSQVIFVPHTISTSTANSVYAVDTNGDGDIDVLSASLLDHKIAWYENDGNENFSAHIITTGANFASSVYAVDVDGDGDVDVLSASLGDDKIAWYENDGNENFSTHAITTTADGALSVYAVDVDGDGDMDVLSASLGDDKIAWYENDGSENFSAHTITTNLDAPFSVYAEDLAVNGDMEIVVSGHWTNSGTFVAGSGEVVFNGTQNQTITNTFRGNVVTNSK